MRNSMFVNLLKKIKNISIPRSKASKDKIEKMTAFNQFLLIIELDLSGNILTANENCLELMKYDLKDILGKHHSIFFKSSFENDNEDKEAWQKLIHGASFTNTFKCLEKKGHIHWIQASFNPVFEIQGNVKKVLVLVSKISEEELKNLDASKQFSAINRTQSVIEFDLKGNILFANEHFLNMMEYSWAQIEGKHREIFSDIKTLQSVQYHEFWEKLLSGESVFDEFKRRAKNGREVWISASYIPILDEKGAPFKVLELAKDITSQKNEDADFLSKVSAINKSQTVIVMTLDGTILDANENFLHILGYQLEEIKGKHHSLFVDEKTRISSEYKQIWQRLNRGEFTVGELLCVDKKGKNVWIQATYNPIFDASGKPYKVVKFSTDITEQKLKNADFEGQINAISKSQAIIEFNMDGTVRFANANFLNSMGYELNELQGKHHSIFIDKEYRTSPEYKAFWEKLNRGEFESAQFRRIAKDGKDVWIQATYNPISDLSGKPFKVVKYATDITAKKRAIALISDSLMSLSKGDLSMTINEEFDPEFEPVRIALNSTIERLNELVNDIAKTSNEVSRIAREIKIGTNDLHDRTESQASSLEETSVSMQQITSNIEQNAQTSKNSVSLATKATQKAERGGKVIAEAIGAMIEIEHSSKQISDIIGVINEIAFQTNLLALNAAVEAARAGEQGRGFAVVAGEVRNLAQRSAKASIEIRELINASVENIKEGTYLVRESGDNLIAIVEATKNVANMIDSISLATQEQSLGMNEINLAVTDMDNMTQENATLAEKTTAVSENLSVEAETLLELVRFFNTRNP